MKIAIGQINPTVGALRFNAHLVLEAVTQARAAGARLVVLPELCLTGYPPRDLLSVSGFVEQADDALSSVVGGMPEGIVAAVGTVRRLTDGRLANAAVFVDRGRVIKEIPKALLPTYDVFDERRYFEPATPDADRVVCVDGVRVGVTICEDMWNDRLLWGEQRRYQRDPVAEAVEQGADLLVNLSASPFAVGKEGVRARLVRHAATRWRRPVVYAAAIGGNDGLIFDGGSLAARADGEFVDLAPLFQSDLRVFDTDGPAVQRHAIGEMEELCGALTLGLSDYARKTGLTGAIIGLSGGIDSALVASLACLALGPANVMGVAMPSRYSSSHSVDDARTLASALGIEFQIIPIEHAHAAYETLLTPLLESTGPAGAADVTFENVQARIRGAVLMALSNRTGRLLLTTGNKSECSVGYCTLYGDTCGGLAVIAERQQAERRDPRLDAHQAAVCRVAPGSARRSESSAVRGSRSHPGATRRTRGVDRTRSSGCGRRARSGALHRSQALPRRVQAQAIRAHPARNVTLLGGPRLPDRPGLDLTCARSFKAV
jgi:NAD+ synthase (glutamine-hydrolysing)